MREILKTVWYDKTVKVLQLAGKAEGTQEGYARAVRMLIEFTKKDPNDITEKELQDYFLFRINSTKWANNTMKACYCGLKFFFIDVLRKDWHTFKILKAQTEKRLPCVLSREEVFRLLCHVKLFRYYCFLSTVYACGLRHGEALSLQVSDIDKDRMQIHVHRGKGAKDRFTPLPNETLILLRQYWSTHRNNKLLFPALGRDRKGAHEAQHPMNMRSVQKAFRKAKLAAGIKKRRVTVHTLRHSYATHMLEAGVNIRVIQRYLGHAKLETTMVYLHLTTKGQEDAYEIINNQMKGFIK